MINGKKVIGVIPARGGSKGVPRKNIRQVGGKPLLAWTVEAARGSRYIDRLVLSSDDREIIAVAESLGLEVPFRRPDSLSGDETSGSDVFVHALEALPGYDYGVLLQPTSPLRSASDIDACIERCHESGADAALSVVKPDKSPFWMLLEDENQELRPLLDAASFASRRQDLPEVFVPNGAVYTVRTQYLLENKAILGGRVLGCLMPAGRSLDIDEEHDFQRLEAQIAQGGLSGLGEEKI